MPKLLYLPLTDATEPIVAKFNKNLAEWSINTYGNKNKASSALKRSESMLSKDLKMDRLK